MSAGRPRHMQPRFARPMYRGRRSALSRPGSPSLRIRLFYRLWGPVSLACVSLPPARGDLAVLNQIKVRCEPETWRALPGLLHLPHQRAKLRAAQ